MTPTSVWLKCQGASPIDGGRCACRHPEYGREVSICSHLFIVPKNVVNQHSDFLKACRFSTDFSGASSERDAGETKAELYLRRLCSIYIF